MCLAQKLIGIPPCAPGAGCFGQFLSCYILYMSALASLCVTELSPLSLRVDSCIMDEQKPHKGLEDSVCALQRALNYGSQGRKC